MKSIFAYAEQSQGLLFWKDLENPESPISSKIIHSGSLTELTPLHKFKKRYFAITKDSFLKAKSSSSEYTKASKIEWKTIEPFIEENGEERYYGFQIIQGIVQRHFYVKSSRELDVWLSFLSRIGIMTDIRNDFKFKKSIGISHSSNLYLATDLENNKDYAIKCIPKRQIRKGTVLNSIINEITILRTLNHPFITKLHKVYESSNYIHLVLDRASGGNLAQRIQNKGPLPEVKAAKLIKNLLEVLEYLDSMKIVHRDIQLENIFLTSEKSDSDFILGDCEFAFFANSESVQSFVTPGYAAPEMVQRKAYDTKVDVFSVGIILYFILSGITKWTEKIRNEMVQQVGYIGTIFCGSQWKNISKEAKKMVLNLIKYKPSLRPSPAEALKSKWFANCEKKSLSERPKKKTIIIHTKVQSYREYKETKDTNIDTNNDDDFVKRGLSNKIKDVFKVFVERNMEHANLSKSNTSNNISLSEAVK